MSLKGPSPPTQMLKKRAFAVTVCGFWKQSSNFVSGSPPLDLHPIWTLTAFKSLTCSYFAAKWIMIKSKIKFVETFFLLYRSIRRAVVQWSSRPCPSISNLTFFVYWKIFRFQFFVCVILWAPKFLEVFAVLACEAVLSPFHLLGQLR